MLAFYHLYTTSLINSIQHENECHNSNYHVTLKLLKKKRILDMLFLHSVIIRVGSHVVYVRIRCTEKWPTSFHTDVLSKSK